MKENISYFSGWKYKPNYHFTGWNEKNNSYFTGWNEKTNSYVTGWNEKPTLLSLIGINTTLISLVGEKNNSYFTGLNFLKNHNWNEKHQLLFHWFELKKTTNCYFTGWNYKSNIQNE